MRPVATSINAPSHILKWGDCDLTFDILVTAKGLCPISFNDGGMTMLFRLRHQENAQLPILSNVSGSIICVSRAHDENEASSIRFTPCGTLTRLTSLGISGDASSIVSDETFSL